MCVRSWSLKLDFLCLRVHGNRYPEKGGCVFIYFSFVEHSGSCLVLKIPSKYLSNISLFDELCSNREIHPLDPQPNRHSMLVPRVCAPRVTR